MQAKQERSKTAKTDYSVTGMLKLLAAVRGAGRASSEKNFRKKALQSAKSC